jgi:hypothetical protein
MRYKLFMRIFFIKEFIFFKLSILLSKVTVKFYQFVGVVLFQIHFTVDPELPGSGMFFPDPGPA